MSPTPLIALYAEQLYDDEIIQQASESEVVPLVWEMAQAQADLLCEEEREELLNQIGWERSYQLYNEVVSDSEGEVSTRELCRVLIGLEALYDKVSGQQ
jgi:hypothetical protein